MKEKERERGRRKGTVHERVGERKRKKIKKILAFCYNRVLKMRFYYSSMLKILRFKIFDVGGF